jgi:hypothetical protein
VIEKTEKLKGQVLLVNGDFTRLQTFGSPSLHWVRVTVNPATEQLFQIEPVIVKHAK